MFKNNKTKKAIAIICTLALTLCFAACGQSTQKGPVKIATKPMTEGYILGEMLGLLIENFTEYDVEITKGIGGGTSNIHPAMQNGDFDLYPEYTSSGWVLVLGQEQTGITDEEMYEQLNAMYNEQFDMSWMGLYGFNNTYTLALNAQIANEHNIKTTSDLAALTKTSSEIIFGGNPDYIERADGLQLVIDTYGLNFTQISDIDIGLKYTALQNGDIHVTNAYTTDAQLASDGVVALEDDKNLQVNYYCSTVVRNDALENYEGLEEALSKMDNILSDSEMAQLNYKVEVDGQDEREVAMQFLVEKGILEAQ